MSETPGCLAQGVYRIDAIKITNFINVLLLEEEDGWTLMHTGVGSSVGPDSEPADLKRPFLMRRHEDHLGILKRLLEWVLDVEVSATGREAEVVSDGRGLDPSSDPDMRRLNRNAKPPGIPVGKVVGEGDAVSGFRLTSTPVHTLGHVSLLRDEDGLLFAADAFGCLPRKLRVGVRKAFCTDPAEAKNSVEKFLEQGFLNAILSHGAPPLRAEAKELLRSALLRCDYTWRRKRADEDALFKVWRHTTELG